MNSLLGTLAFLSLFHIIGGIALGVPLRQLLHRRFTCNSLFFLAWGSMFGITPFAFGVSVFGLHGNVLYLGLEIAIFLGAVLVVALVPDWFLAAFDGKRIVPVAMGGVFLVLGVLIGIVMWSENLAAALLFLLAFGGSGAVLFVTSIRDAFKS